MAAWLLLGWSGGATAAAQSACAELGGTVGQDQICHGHIVTTDYTLDLSYPVSYPDQQPLAGYLLHTRDEWSADAKERVPAGQAAVSVDDHRNGLPIGRRRRRAWCST